MSGVTPSTLLLSTGELIELADAPVDVIGRIAEDIDIRLSELRSDKRAIGDEITRRLDFEGRRSLEIDGWKFETTAPEERQIDVPALQAVLLDLVTEGTISQKKADKIIAWEPKVVWAELKSLTTDPRCQNRINRTISMKPAVRYGKVKRG
jgi:hypothetical protein